MLDLPYIIVAVCKSVIHRLSDLYGFLTLGAHAHEGYSTHFVCVCVCLEFAAFNSRLYIKYVIPVYFSFVLNFDKKPLLSRKSVFHGYFVVYSR